MKKRILALGLAMTMVMGMGLTAFAEEVPDEPTISTTDNLGTATQALTAGTNKMAMPAIKVSVPTKVPDIILNPYREAVVVDEDAGTTSNAALVTSPMYIYNFGTTPLSISVQNFAVTASGLEVSEEAIAAAETEKMAFIFLETAATEKALKGTYDAKSALMKVVTNGADAWENATTVALPTTSKTGDVTPSSVVFKLAGALTSAPETAWAAADKFDVTFTYKFDVKANAVK
ncbi:MAG: hypothetical protein IJ833_01315 [Lachnospiraceae bacterium]|nr:hypothetical protein [Lachnospiraceae bacterium]